MTIALRACQRCGGDTNEREDIQAGIILTCIQCGGVEYPGYVLDTDKRVKVEECTVPGCEKEAGRLVEKICYMHKSRLARGYSPDSPEFHAPAYRIGYRA